MAFERRLICRKWLGSSVARSRSARECGLGSSENETREKHQTTSSVYADYDMILLLFIHDRRGYIE
jgi:hypothetical protein